MGLNGILYVTGEYQLINLDKCWNLKITFGNPYSNIGIRQNHQWML